MCGRCGQKLPQKLSQNQDPNRRVKLRLVRLSKETSSNRDCWISYFMFVNIRADSLIPCNLLLLSTLQRRPDRGRSRLHAEPLKSLESPSQPARVTVTSTQMSGFCPCCLCCQWRENTTPFVRSMPPSRGTGKAIMFPVSVRPNGPRAMQHDPHGE